MLERNSDLALLARSASCRAAMSAAQRFTLSHIIYNTLNGNIAFRILDWMARNRIARSLPSG